MELQDNAIIYHTEYQTTKKMIEKLKNINIDVTKLENELIKIYNNTEEEISKVDITLNNFGIDVIYGNSITRLRKLQSIIDNYNFYFQINNLVNLLELNLKDDITLEELNGYINDIKKYLSEIKTSSTIDYSDEEVIINKLYDIAYKIIKKEIILTSNSTLLEYIQKSETDINYIDTRVRKELNTVYSKNILNRKYQIDSLGIYANYADLLLIKEIVSITNKEITSKLSREEIIKLKRLKEEYESNKEKIKVSEIDNGKKISILEQELKDVKKEINYYRLRISTTFISWLLCAVTTINVGIFGLPKLAKETKYNTTTTTYTNSVDNKIETLPEYTSEINDGKKVTLIEYSPYSKIAENVYQRNVVEYDLSELNIDNISEYFDLKLEELDIPFNTEIQQPTASELKADDFYTDEQRKLIIQTQDFSDSIEETFGLGVFIMEFFYIIIMFYIWVCVLEFSTRSLSEFSLFELLDRTKELLTMKVDYKKKREELDKIKEKLLKLLEKDEQLKIGFNNAYNIVVSKYGTNNELEDLYNQVNNIEISETIELPEDYFNPKKKVKIPITRKEG